MRILIEMDESKVIELVKPEITQDEVFNLMQLIDMPTSDIIDDVKFNPEYFEPNPFVDKKDIESEPEEESKRSRQLPLQNTSDSEGFALSDSVRISGSDRVQAEIIFPNCQVVTVDDVPEFFNHMKCKKCETKVFLKPVSWQNKDIKDEKGNSKVGKFQYFTRDEREKYKAANGNVETEDDVIKKFNTDVLIGELESYTVNTLKKALSVNGYTNYSHLVKNDLIKFIVDNEGYIDHDDDGKIKF